jgi:hypothetical protein
MHTDSIEEPRGKVLPFHKADQDAIAEAEGTTAALRIQIGDWEPPSNERWEALEDPILPSLRLAWVTVMHKSSAEVAEIVRGCHADALAQLMRNINWTAGYLAKLHALCTTAESRLMAHGAPAAVQDWLQDAPLPPEPPQNWRA